MYLLLVVVIEEQQQYLKRLETLMTENDAQNIRYLKTFLVGPPGVGKTTTLNHLLNIITNILTASDKAKIPSTFLANCIQVFAFVSSDGTEWISSSNLTQKAICYCSVTFVDINLKMFHKNVVVEVSYYKIYL